MLVEFNLENVRILRKTGKILTGDTISPALKLELGTTVTVIDI